MASLLRRAIIYPKFHPFRFASSSAAASQPSAPHIENEKSQQKQESADATCPTRKLTESSSFSPYSIRTDSMDVSKALDSAVQRLKQESEDQLIEEDELSLEIIGGLDPFVTLKIKAPEDIIEAVIDLDSRRRCCYEHVKVEINKEDDQFEYEYKRMDNTSIYYRSSWETWQNHFHLDEDVGFETMEVEELMIGRVKSYVECVLAKRGINKSMIQWLRDRRRRAKQLAWMGSVKDFLQN